MKTDTKKDEPTQGRDEKPNERRDALTWSRWTKSDGMRGMPSGKAEVPSRHDGYGSLKAAWKLQKWMGKALHHHDCDDGC